jgi:hypothetical protein
MVILVQFNETGLAASEALAKDEVTMDVDDDDKMICWPSTLSLHIYHLDEYRL